jgi:hypothetical protein
MSQTVEERLSSIRSKQGDAQRRAAKADAQRDEAAARKDKAMALLKTEFDCETVEQASKKLTTLRAQTDDVLSKIEEKVAGL